MINKLPEYETMLFTEVYADVDTFLEDYHSNGLPALVSDESMTTLFYLLYARYANNPIANMDINQFKYKLFSIVWQYGPAWEKRVDIQAKLRDLSDDELLAGSRQIFNHAYNPSTEPTTSTLEELTFINEQNSTNIKRGKLEAYGTLWELLKVDVTNEFLNKFLVCFKKFVRHARPTTYISEGEE